MDDATRSRLNYPVFGNKGSAALSGRRPTREIRMSDAVTRVERRSQPRYICFRDCDIFALDTKTEVSLLNVSLCGVATLGPELAVAPGDRIVLSIEGISVLLEAIVIRVSYGRIGAHFDLSPDVAEVWAAEFAEMVEGAAPI